MAEDINSIIDRYSSSNDFGFTTSDATVHDIEERENDYLNRLRQVEELVLPLFTNLLKTADQPTIHWPNRKEIMEQKISELLKLTRTEG